MTGEVNPLDTEKGVLERMVNRDDLSGVPTFFVDGYAGVAYGGGVARILLCEAILNTSEEASLPSLRAVANLCMPEIALLEFAQAMVDRATALGIDGNVRT